MHKKDVLSAIPPLSDATGLVPYLNSDINAHAVSIHLSGKLAITEFIAASTGLNCGLPRAIPFGSFANFLAIVILRLRALRTTGSNKYPKKRSIIPGYNMCFMMQPTFTRTAAC